MRRVFHVLVIDDDEDDQFLLQTAFQPDNDRFRFFFASSGSMVVESRLPDDYTPDLIFLDLNMPIISGFEVLEYLKTSPRFRHIPVIILSTSSEEQDINRCYEMGANTYMVKPSTHHDLLHLANQVRAYWFSWPAFRHPELINCFPNDIGLMNLLR